MIEELPIPLGISFRRNSFFRKKLWNRERYLVMSDYQGGIETDDLGEYDDDENQPDNLQYGDG